MTTPDRTGLRIREVTGTAKVRRADESELQMAIVAYVKLAAPKQMFFSIPNHGVRSRAGGAKQKAMGLRPGMPDLCFILARNHVGFMELKVGKNKLSPAQEAFAVWCKDNLVPYAVVTNLDTAVEVLRGWGVIR